MISEKKLILEPMLDVCFTQSYKPPEISFRALFYSGSVDVFSAYA